MSDALRPDIPPDDDGPALCADGCGSVATDERLVGIDDTLPDADAIAGLASQGRGVLEVELVCGACKVARP